VANVFEPEFDSDREREGFRWTRAKVGKQAGAERLGASLYEVPPGQTMFPYHVHAANEEMLIVLRGRPHLRSPEGWRQLEEGEVVAAPVGPSGAHQVQNRSDDSVRVLVISEMRAPEIVFQPDSGKFLAATRPPGGSPKEGDMFETFRLDSGVDYWEGESPPS
jgi:uncharacterized cupin superfamily protein